MISVYCAIALVGGIGLWLTYMGRMALEPVKGPPALLIYLLTRPLMLAVLEQRSTAQAVVLVLELLLLFLWHRLRRESGKEEKEAAISFYLWNPVGAAAVISGKPEYLLLFHAVFYLVNVQRNMEQPVILSRKRKKQALWHMGAGTVAGYGCLMARELWGQTYSQCVSFSEEVPVLLILSSTLLMVTGISWIFVCHRWRMEPDEASENMGEERLCPEKREPCSRRDGISILLFTVLSAVLIFSGLGSRTAPQTGMVLKEGNNQIVLNFKQFHNISKLLVYLGPESKRKISVSIPDQNREWECIASKENLESVFQWNTLELNCRTYQLGLVFMDELAYVDELVLLDDGGNRLLPDNAASYPELFDEQELCPKYATYYYRMMFDEIYHGRTAYENLHGLPIYEISHPPLGKDLMSIGIWLFGMTPFGWRFICACFGVLMTPLLYLFARTLFGKWETAVFVTGLLTVECMHFTLSRIGTIDIIVAFFILTMFYLMLLALQWMKKNHGRIEESSFSYRERKVLLLKEAGILEAAGLAAGCAVASKWTAFYGGAGLAVMMFWYLWQEYGTSPARRKAGSHLPILFVFCCGAFIITPLILYGLSYLPYVSGGRQGELLETVIENSKGMFLYHSKTIFDHPYSSEWYEWPWIRRPLLDAFTSLEAGKVSVVATMGNPIIWWGGMAALIHQFYLWMIRKEKTAGFLCIFYISMLAPWLFIHRTVFIYQYFVCSLVLVLMLGNSFAHMRQHRKKMAIFFGGAAFIFLLFYPVISGYPIAGEYVRQILEWMTSWNFA